jgi:hypothetical protein
VRLVATEYVSLDGVFEEPGQWSFPFFTDQAAQFKWRELQASDALLLCLILTPRRADDEAVEDGDQRRALGRPPTDRTVDFDVQDAPRLAIWTYP